MDAREKTLTTQTTGQIRDRFGYKRGGAAEIAVAAVNTAADAAAEWR